ncbi:MAG TPA: IS1595 family transposase, partial [Bryobacteraceae bacterium]
NQEFPDDTACLEFLKEQRFPGGIALCDSDKCGVERKHYRVTGRTAYACDHCGHHIYPLAGTIFEKSTTSLKLWFHAMFQMGSTKCGISAKQIQRETGVTYKTAWRMFKQIRTLMSEELSLEGDAVEVDEMYHGGKRKGKNGRPGIADKKKIPVVGLAERGTSDKAGRIVARIAVDTKQETLYGMVRECVLPKSTVYTDEYSSYKGLHAIEKVEKGEDGKPVGKPMGYEHRRINHSSGVYVNGDVHTNTIEGFWSLIKRGIGGTHHMVSQKFLQEYLNEYSFRYNRRDVARPMFKLILERVAERAQ